VIEVTSVGGCYFDYYAQDGNLWKAFMDVNRFGVLQYRGADAPDTLYVEEAELDSVVSVSWDFFAYDLYQYLVNF